MSLGLESKEGALRALGEAFPAEKLTEIRQELIEDAKSDGALKMVQTQIENDIMTLTGMQSAQLGPGGAPAQPVGGGSPEQGVPQSVLPPVIDDATIAAQMGRDGIRANLVTQAYGTQLPQRRVPEVYEK